MILELWNIWTYQSNVKPPHTARDLDLLKLSTTSVRMGA